MSMVRSTVAVVSVGLLLALGGWSIGAGRVDGPARVEAAAEFRVTHAGDGRVRWTLLDGRTPGGPVVVADGVLQGDRGDPVEVEREAGLVAGLQVEAGASVARVKAPRLSEAVSTLAAEQAALEAEQALVEAGGRPEAVARAQQAVEVAEAALAQAEAEQTHLEGLVAAGAGAAWPVEEARRQVRVRRAERDLARASRDEARVPARPEELTALVARQAVVQARLVAAQDRVSGQSVSSPIAGSIQLPGGETLVSVIGDGPVMLHVAVDEGDRDAVAPGDAVVFTPTASVGRRVAGKVVAVGSQAGNLGGEPVVWLVASLDEALAIGSTGRARVVSGGAP